MSVYWQNYAWSDEGPLDPVDRAIFVKICDNGDEEGQCFPSLSYLAQKTRWSEATVKRSLKHLEEQGYIEILEVGTGRLIQGQGRNINRTRRHTCRYQLHKVERSPQGTLNGVHTEPRSHKTGFTQNPNGVHTEPQMGFTQKIPHTPYKVEPSLNHQEPSITPPNPPYPLFGKRGRIGLPLVDPVSVNLALETFCRTLGVTSPRVRDRLIPVIEFRINAKSPKDVGKEMDVGEEMIAAWRSYINHPKRLGRAMSMSNFFTEGHWLNRDSWIMLTGRER